jgi:hypothetical protein
MPNRPNPKLFGLTAILLAEQMDKERAAAEKAAKEDDSCQGHGDEPKLPPTPESGKG